MANTMAHKKIKEYDQTKPLAWTLVMELKEKRECNTKENRPGYAPCDHLNYLRSTLRRMSDT